MNQKNTALFQIHFATLIFGISGVFGKVIASSAEVIVFGRGFFAFIMLSLFCLKWRQIPWHGMSKKSIVLSLMVGAMLALHWYTFFLGVKIGGVAVSMLGFAGFPLFVALIEIFFLKLRPKKIELLLIAMVFVGLLLVAPSFDFADKGTIGLLWGILSAIFYAILTILNRQGVKGYSPTSICWWQYIGLMLLLFPFSVGQFASISMKDLCLIAWLGVMCTGLAYGLFVKSLLVLKASTASMVSALEPVYAIVLAYFVFGDMPGIKMVFGGSLIILAVLLTGKRNKDS